MKLQVQRGSQPQLSVFSAVQCERDLSFSRPRSPPLRPPFGPVKSAILVSKINFKELLGAAETLQTS